MIWYQNMRSYIKASAHAVRSRISYLHIVPNSECYACMFLQQLVCVTINRQLCKCQEHVHANIKRCCKLCTHHKDCELATLIKRMYAP